MDKIPDLETERVYAHFDDETQTAYIHYKGLLSAETTAEAYQWIRAMVTVFHGQVPIRQAVFDFREVTDFDASNLGRARNESRSLNRSFDLSTLPVALVVGNEEQAKMVALSTKTSGQSERTRIVWSDEERAAFFEEWWQTHTPPPRPDALDE